MKYLFSLLILFVFILQSCSPNAAEHKQALDSAVLKEAYALKDYNTAAAVLHQMYAADNNQAYLLDSIFYCYAYTRNYASASLLATKRLPAHGSDERFQLAAADSYRENKQFEDAAALYNKLLVNYKDSVELYYQFGQCLFETQQYDESIKAMEAVLALPGAKAKPVMVKAEQVNYFAAAMNMIAICKIKQGKFADAKKALQGVMSVAPFFQAAKVNYEKVNMLQQMGSR